MGSTKNERATPETFNEKTAVLTVQVLWACHAWNATPKEAAQQIVADLYAHLSKGGTVSVRVEGLDGNGCTLEVSVK